MATTITLRAAVVLLASLPAAAQLAPTFTGKNVPLLDAATTDAKFMLAADVDKDGVMDLITLVSTPLPALPRVSVLLGRASGGYEAAVTSPLAGSSLQDLAIGDLDGDAFPDLASITLNQRIVTAKGVGDGSFVQSYEYFAGNGVLSAVAIADVNGDAIGDVLSATNTTAGTFNVNFGMPGGGYLATQSWITGHQITSWDLADLDGNGQPDLVASGSGNKLSITMGNGAGGYLGSQLKTTVVTALQVLAAPLDGDADADVLVVASGGSGSTPGLLQPWLNDGAGGMQPAATSTTGLSAVRASLADVDGDGDLDAAVSCNGDATVSLMLNDGAAHFSTADSLPIGTDVSRLELVDASGDGLADVVAQVLGSTATILRADAPADVPTGDAWFNGAMKARAIDVALVDGDGLPDVVVATDNPALATLKGEPGGLQTAPVVSSGYLSATDLVAGDLDGDALSDVVVAPKLGLVFTPYLQVGRGLGTGAFDAPQSLIWSNTDAAAHALELLDIDGDGWRDIAALVPGQPASLVSFRNAGTGALAFDAAQLQAVGNGAQQLAAGDLDADGLDDLVLTEPAGGLQPSAGLYAVLGDGSGVMQPGPFTALPPVSYDPLALALGDMDLDGQLDAIVGDEFEGRIAVALGDGAGGLLASGWEPAEIGADVIKLADVNGDGWPDVAHSPDTGDPAIVLRLGDGAGGLLAPVTTPCADKVIDFALADFTQDAQPDLLVACNGTSLRPSRVHLLPNVAAPFTWKDLGSALAGGTGEPRLVGTGELVTGTPGFVRLTVAKASSPSVLFLSATSTPVAFKGGTLVAFPPLLLLELPTGANGTIDLPWSAWPSNLPGASWFFQFAVQDAGAVHGVALSNAISGTEP